MPNVIGVCIKRSITPSNCATELTLSEMLPQIVLSCGFSKGGNWPHTEQINGAVWNLWRWTESYAESFVWISQREHMSGECWCWMWFPSILLLEHVKPQIWQANRTVWKPPNYANHRSLDLDCRECGAFQLNVYAANLFGMKNYYAQAHYHNEQNNLGGLNLYRLLVMSGMRKDCFVEWVFDLG